MPGIALYIPCFNAEKTIAACLRAALSQECRSLAEVIVVDDGSTDGTLEVAGSFPVRIIRHHTNKGLAAARNTAVSSTMLELVASLDADCLPDPTWLNILSQAIESGPYGIVGGRLIETVTEGLPNRWRVRHMSQDWGPSPIVDPPFMFGNNQLLRKSAVVAMGGYDERFRTNGEDADLSRRLHASGVQTMYAPQAQVYHLRSDTLSSLLNSVWSGWRYGAKAYFRPSAVAAVRNILSHFLGRHYTRILWRDLRHLDLSLLPLDAILPFYMVYRDLTLLSRGR